MIELAEMICAKILVLLVVGLLLIPEGQATYDKMECHECDRMADHCAFRCQWMDTYAKFFYCDDFCKRRDMACQTRCIRRHGQPEVVLYGIDPTGGKLSRAPKQGTLLMKDINVHTRYRKRR